MIYFLEILFVIKDFSFPLGARIELFIELLIGCIVLLFFVLRVIQERYSVKKYIIPIVMLVPLILYHAVAFEMIVLCAYVFRTSQLKRFVVFAMWCRVISIVFLLLLLKAEYLTDALWKVDWKSANAAHTFGLTENPNTTSFFFFQLFIFYYLSARLTKNVFFKTMAHMINIIMAVVVYKYTQSRSFFYSEICLYFISIFIHKKRTVLAVLTLTAPLVLLVVSFVLALLGSNPILNLLTTYRVSHWHLLLHSLRPINWLVGISAPDHPIDSSYMKMFMQGGLIGVIFYFLLYTRFMKTLLADSTIYARYYVFLPVLIALAVEGFMESSIPAVRDISFLYFAVILCVLGNEAKKKFIIRRQ